jgi:hypothetical protein
MTIVLDVSFNDFQDEQSSCNKNSSHQSAIKDSCKKVKERNNPNSSKTAKVKTKVS